MQLFAARIALLAYVIGGIAIPAVHWHSPASGTHGSGAHAAHGPGNHADCCHVATDTAEAAYAVATALRSAEPIVHADAPHAASCGEDCVICAFAGSAQTLPNCGVAILLSEPRLGLVAGSHGPGFAASDLRCDRLRGPPAAVITG